jgi:hypothetical protein
MQRIQQAVGLIFVALGAFLAYQGRAVGVADKFNPGPGPGFFAFWVGLALVAAGLAWLGQLLLRPAPAAPADLIPDRGGMARIGAVLAAMAAFALCLAPFGFNLAMLGFLLLLLLAFDREYWGLKLVVAFAASFGLHALFERALKVPLPYASMDGLRDLGF